MTRILLDFSFLVGDDNKMLFDLEILRFRITANWKMRNLKNICDLFSYIKKCYGVNVMSKI